MKDIRNIAEHIDEMMAQAEAGERIQSGASFTSQVNRRIDQYYNTRTISELSLARVFLRYAAILLITLLNIGALFLYTETESVSSQPQTDVIAEFAEQYFPDYTYTDTDLEEQP